MHLALTLALRRMATVLSFQVLLVLLGRTSGLESFALPCSVFLGLFAILAYGLRGRPAWVFWSMAPALASTGVCMSYVGVYYPPPHPAALVQIVLVGAGVNQND